MVHKSFVSFSTEEGFGRPTHVLFFEGTMASQTTDWTGPKLTKNLLLVTCFHKRKRGDYMFCMVIQVEILDWSQLIMN